MPRWVLAQSAVAGGGVTVEFVLHAEGADVRRLAGAVERLEGRGTLDVARTLAGGLDGLVLGEGEPEGEAATQEDEAPVEPVPREAVGGVSVARLQRAYDAGRAAHEKLVGRRATVAATAPWPDEGERPRSRVYVVLRGYGEVDPEARFFDDWAEAAPFVRGPDGRLYARAVFHGWPSHAEAQVHADAALGALVERP